MITAGIVGLGWWGQNHVNASAGAEGIEFVAGALRHPERVQDFAEEKGLSLHTGLDAMLEEADIDAVVLATPHTLHVEQMLMAIEAGKHVLSEKPFTMSKADAEKVLAAGDAAGVTVAVAHNRRFVPSMAELRKRIADDALGPLLHVEMTEAGPPAIVLPQDSWRFNRQEWPAGGMTPMGVHLIDNMVDLFGRVKNVRARAVRRAAEADIDDTTSVLLEFESGMTGYLAIMITARPDFVASIYGRDATARMIGRMYDHLEIAPREEGETEVFDYDFGRDTDALTAELDAFAAAVQGEAPYPIPADEIVHVVAVLEAVIRAAETGQQEQVA